MANILFRADSSSTIGTGHIMRDLVLAKEFKDSNIIFATQNLPNNVNYKIEQNNYTLEILESNSMDELIDIITKNSIDTVVIDNYEIDYEFEKELKEKTGVKIFVLDDTYEKHFCDILLNHNIYADANRYKDLVPKECELRCGSKYTLLREEFIKEKNNKKASHKDKPLNIFIAMGGADTANINIEILKVLKEFSNIEIDLVTTDANKNLQELKEYAEDKANINLHINTNMIASLMSSSDFAIVTPSVSLNEVYFMGLPFIAIKTAANQSEMYDFLIKNKYLALEKFDPKELRSKIEILLEEMKIYLVNFTKISLDETKMVLEWRNNENIRKWMFNQDEIALDDHLKYIDSLNKRDDRLYFLVKKENLPIGVIDFTNIDITNNSAEFGIYANPDLKGVGSYLMHSIIKYAFRELKLSTLKAEVFAENFAALKLYERHDFVKTDEKLFENKKLICMELKR